MRIWALRANGSHDHDMMQDIFLKQGMCHVRGAEVSEDFKSFSGCPEQFKAAIMRALPDNDARNIEYHVSMNLDFVVNIAVGDVVIVPYKRKALYVGIVKGDYEFTPDASQEMMHGRKVEWFSEIMRKKDIGPDAFKRVFSYSSRSVFEIKSPEAERILKEYKFL